MTTLQKALAAEAPVDPIQPNESEGKVWRQPTLTTWEVPEETQMPTEVSGTFY